MIAIFRVRSENKRMKTGKVKKKFTGRDTEETEAVDNIGPLEVGTGGGCGTVGKTGDRCRA